MMVRPRDLDGVAALAAAESTAMRKLKGEKDTEFIKRIVCAYMNARIRNRAIADVAITTDRIIRETLRR